ncbi:MAG: WD40 repeat domain-containing serine/threonine protein kinase [Gemmataceae bacterium]
MMTDAPHPTAAELQALLQSDAHPAESGWAAHLEQCRACQVRLEELALGTTGWLIATARDYQKEPVLPVPAALQPLALSALLATIAPSNDDTRPDATLQALLPADPTVGPRQRIGPYEVLGIVGRGGMGIVLQGYDIQLERAVALKIPTESMRNDAIARGRFLREGRAAASIVHPNVVPVWAVEEYAGVPVLVMAFVQGESLQQRLDRETKLPPAEAVRIAAEVARGLHAAHERGLVHRDVKPANILLESPAGTAKLTDFGLARAGDDARLTQTGVGAGTPLFMSPEQANGHAVDFRSDLFSLGTLLYTMLAGVPPFATQTLMGTLKRLAEGRPTPLRQFCPDIPYHVEKIVMDLLQTDSFRRPSSAAIVAERLTQSWQFLQNGIDPPRASRRRRTMLTLAALFVMASIVAAGGVVLKFPTPQGILSVEIDDPEAKVSYEQDGKEVTITGVGLKEVKLKLGQLPVKIQSGDGNVTHEIVTIEKNNKTVVRATLKPNPGLPVKTGLGEAGGGFMPGAGPAAGGTPFVPPGVSAGRGVRPLGATTPLPNPVPVTDPALDALNAPPKAFRRVDDVTNAPTTDFWATPGVPQRAVRVSPDGKYLLSASTWPVADGMIRVWDTATGQVVHTLQGSKGDIPSIILSPDGKSAISSSEDGVVRFWDYAAGKQTRTFQSTPTLNIALVLSPKGDLLASGGDSSEIYINETATGKPVRTLKVPQPSTLKELLPEVGWKVTPPTTEGGPIYITPKMVMPSPMNVPPLASGTSRYRIRALAFSPDAKRLFAGSEDGIVRAFHVPTGEILWEKNMENGWIESLVVRGETLLVGNRILEVLRGSTGESLQKHNANEWGITAMAIDPTGQFLLTTGSDGHAFIYRFGGLTLEPAQALRVGMGNCNGIAFTPDGKAVYIACGGHYYPDTGKFESKELGIRRINLETMKTRTGLTK